MAQVPVTDVFIALTYTQNEDGLSQPLLQLGMAM